MDGKPEETITVKTTVQTETTQTAEEILASVKKAEQSATKVLADALREVFGENEKSGRFVDVSRIPLICQNINTMHGNLEDIRMMMEKAIADSDKRYVNHDQWWPVKTIVYSGTGAVLLAVVGAVVALIIKT